ncbi:unnamed protein product [Fusarium graminearum]|uniref:Chromosome 3, complete genome n=1 Tax=Gibberella zeae (strain ATCC MYA-4620 / CBS 123657 / FGSC 9075 / NRRL 31084 / PH-1) TaxID=229533 RepID=A0A098DZV6_GIBZE|nr:unnamed protein product [Fusarium graminearum]CZS85225.1 unnamed protein product [Fusarium graminearum]
MSLRLAGSFAFCLCTSTLGFHHQLVGCPSPRLFPCLVQTPSIMDSSRGLAVETNLVKHDPGSI